ncbi:MAG: Ger(x)C family spore germination protein [Deltaproteobacteria bacterium]
MLKRVSVLGLIVILTIGLAGCWDSRDIDKQSFPLCAAYDLHIDGDQGKKQVDVTTLIPNLSVEAPSKVHVQTLSERTVAYARRPRNFYDADEYLPGINQVLIIGDDLVRQGFKNHLDTLGRIPSISGTMLFAVADGRGEEILKTPSKNFPNNGIYLIDLLGDAQRKSFIPTVRLYELFLNLGPGKNPILPVVKKQGDKVIISGGALFKKDHLIDLCSTEETRTLMMLRGSPGQGYYPFELQREGKKEWGTVYIGNARKVKVTRQGNQYTYSVNIKLSGSIVEYINHPENLDKECLACVEDSIARSVESECRRFLDKMQNELKTDCIDINKYALAKWRRELTPVIDQEEFIQNAKINVKVEVELENAGETL